MRAVLGLSLARRSSRLPEPTLSVVDSESATSWSMLSVWASRLAVSSVWSEEISAREDSTALVRLADAAGEGERGRTVS